MRNITKALERWLSLKNIKEKLLNGRLFLRNITKALEHWLSLKNIKEKLLNRELLLKSIKKTPELWLRIGLPLAAIILALYSIGISNYQLQLAQRAQEITISHYFQSEEPALQYQQISLDLIRLNNKIKQAEQWITQSQMPEASIMKLEEDLGEAKYWSEETDKALFEYRLLDAEGYNYLAHENVDKVLRELSKEVFELPAISVWAKGFLAVGIDNLTTGRTKEGEPLETVIIAIADTPISSGYPHRIIHCYEISPDGAILDNQATFTFVYNPDDIPFGFYEEDLVGAMWDLDNEQWSIRHDSRVDLQKNSISVTVNQLSYFAIIAQYPKLPQPINWIVITAIFLSLPFLLVFVIVLIINRRQQDGRTCSGSACQRIC